MTDASAASGVPGEREGAGETVTWGYCAVDCPCRCPLKFHVRNGRVVRVEPCRRGDVRFIETGGANKGLADEADARSGDGDSDKASVAESGTLNAAPRRNAYTGPVPVACHRGIAMGRLAESPTRLKWPLRRTGPRGSGRFERLSWDEAIELACSQLERVIRTYGNEAVYINYGTGTWSTTSKSFQRLLNLLGGKLGRYNNYSNAQINAAARYLYGAAGQGSSLSCMRDAQTVIAFGWNPCGTRQGGASDRYHWPRMARELSRRGAKVYLVDCRRTESCVEGVEWVPVRPGTDAALALAIAHEVVAWGRVDYDFLSRCCTGFDDTTMPAAYQGKHLSFRDYLMGTGFDHIEKTPAWASAITSVPQAKIREMARAVAASSAQAPLYVTQGWGPQRRSNGEWTAAAIMALPCLVGQVGLPGTNNGERERSATYSEYGLPTGESAVSASIPAFLFTDAIAAPERMTSETAGVRGANRLSTGIKYLINYAGNCLTNQHGDLNRAHDILADEHACEFILGIDCEMTDSAKHCDLLLPDLYRFELPSQASAGFDEVLYLTTGSPAPTRRFERKSAYQIAELMAQRLGVGEAFACGRTEADWARVSYDRVRARHPELPGWDETAKGPIAVPLAPKVALADFRADPASHPLATPSGKIELFSAKLLGDTGTWKVRPDDTIPGWQGLRPDAPTLAPVPAYLPEWDERDSHGDRLPLQLTGYHFAGRVHSCWGGIARMQERWPQELLMNPADAAARGIRTGDTVRVSNAHGATELSARVTGNVVEGTVAMPQGAWHSADMEGDRVDRAGSINVLTGHRPSPLSFGNPQHTIRCECEKVRPSLAVE